MKNRTSEELFIRKALAKNLINKRKLAKNIINYSKYNLSTRKTVSVMNCISYLKQLVDDFNKLENEYNILCNLYYNIKLDKIKKES